MLAEKSKLKSEVRSIPHATPESLRRGGDLLGQYLDVTDCTPKELAENIELVPQFIRPVGCAPVVITDDTVLRTKAPWESTQGLESKAWDNLPQKPAVVITLCAGAAGEACPVYFGNVVRSHWGMPDPAGVQGDEATIKAAFAETVAVLRRRISALVQQLEANPSMDVKTLQGVLDGIAVQ